ncbi:protealysin inhibitor emfourin [Arthrobacter agilis]|uniref:protealysin inhibitor emfourin n=1 Tax=Arthrobacter agilis TaxID=37921 RepID=UPI001ABF1F0E|nr:protealysin inhibitor emfourin [Arthrobacter agilis]
MHLEVTRSGGFAGLTRHWSTDIPDAECSLLITALKQADNKYHNHPDDRVYAIHLGATSASVPELQTRHGILATLIERAQDGNHDR